MEVFIELLRESGYDGEGIKFLQSGFTEGFNIGYEGPQIRQSKAKNIPFSVGNKTELWNKLIKEVKLGCVAGPFDQIPFENYIQSPIGLVPKVGAEQTNQTRLIFHLLYDFKDEANRLQTITCPGKPLHAQRKMFCLLQGHQLCSANFY